MFKSPAPAALIGLSLSLGAVSARKNRGRRQEQTAQIIAQQLGGLGRLQAMIGAKNFLNHGNALSFRFPAKSRNKSNHIKIELTPRDDYTVTFGKIRGYDFKVIEVVEGVYASQLRDIIEDRTGLYLSLGTMGR